MEIGSRKRGYIYITDSLCCPAETNSTVKNDVTIKDENNKRVNQDT